MKFKLNRNNNAKQLNNKMRYIKMNYDAFCIRLENLKNIYVEMCLNGLTPARKYIMLQQLSNDMILDYVDYDMYLKDTTGEIDKCLKFGIITNELIIVIRNFLMAPYIEAENADAKEEMVWVALLVGFGIIFWIGIIWCAIGWFCGWY